MSILQNKRAIRSRKTSGGYASFDGGDSGVEMAVIEEEEEGDYEEEESGDTSSSSSSEGLVVTANEEELDESEMIAVGDGEVGVEMAVLRVGGAPEEEGGEGEPEEMSMK